MKNAKILLSVLYCLMLVGVTDAKKKGYTTIQDRILTYSAGYYLEGEPLEVGYDIFGDDYQATCLIARTPMPILADMDSPLALDYPSESRRTYDT